jgi:tRNA A-37 threonylcarbamoyl transferase component Bud32
MPQLGRYEILQRLARGNIADVLLARASGLEGFARHVVIKQIRPEHAIDTRFVDAFLAEARIGASLNHQNIVQVFDIDQVGGSPFFAMEYVHGEDARRLLQKVVSKGKLVPIEIVVAIGAAAAAGLHHAHEQNGPDRQPLNLVHRDVSPSNILIGYDGSVKLVDFGLAKPALQAGSKTRTGALCKAPYMSPELCMGKNVDRRSDVFALGTVLYELSTARRLFKGDTDYHTMSMIVESAVPPPSTLRPELPPELDEIIMRALAKDPAARFQTAYDLRSALEGLAIEHELRTTAKAVADYLASVFGARPEPWHVAVGERESDADEGYDFESVHGLVPTPSNGLRMIEQAKPDAASPIALAREVARGNTPDPDFDEHPTRLDIAPEQEETATVSSKRNTITSAGDSTTTAAQPIVDVLTGVQPASRRTASTMTVREEDARLNDTNTSTLEDAYIPDEPKTIDQRSKRVSTPPPPLPRMNGDRRSPLPRALQPGPHGAIVPRPSSQVVTRADADTDAADEATTVEPPMFPMPEPQIVGRPPESVYLPQARLPIQLTLVQRWGIVAAMIFVPLVIGVAAHACGEAKAPAVHGGR